MRYLLPLIALCAVGLSACQPAEPEEPPREAAVLDYTLLGIWQNRLYAYEISEALKTMGIQSKLSGYEPCLLNVETAKLGQAMDIVAANPAWQQTRIR